MDKSKPTQLNPALRQLGISMIAAYSPQARGRSERQFRTHQARLPKELAAAKIKDMNEANCYLREVYIPAFNAEFMHKAMEAATGFVPYQGSSLEDILCEQYERVVAMTTVFHSVGGVIKSPRIRTDSTT